MITDTSEKGLERLICTVLTGDACDPPQDGVVRERPSSYGVKHGPRQIDLLCVTPSPGNARAATLYNQNRFSATRQLRYSSDESRLALDLCLFVNGLKTDYLWKEVLTRDSLTNVIENYAQIVASKDEKTGRRRQEQIWPRYHQLDVVRKLLADDAPTPEQPSPE